MTVDLALGRRRARQARERDGPVIDGACPDTGDGIPQTPIDNPFGVPGSVCAPECPFSATCPQHSQTSAPASCYVSVGNADYCVNRCYVDPTLIGGNQCQCGATCQPQGSPDGEGNLRGICTFE